MQFSRTFPKMASLKTTMLPLWLFALLTMSAAAEASPARIACVGDSITFGAGASSAQTTYPADLQQLYGAGTSVGNFGHSGATLLTTGDTPYTIQPEYQDATDFVSKAPLGDEVAVVILLGTNDSKSNNWKDGASSAQFATDYAALIDHFATLATHPTIYVGLPLSAFANGYNISGTVIRDDIIPVIKHVASQKHLPVIDLNTPTANLLQDLPDGVHPNDAGNTIVAKIVHDAIAMGPNVDGGIPDSGLPKPSPDAGAGAQDAAVSVDAAIDANAPALDEGGCGMHQEGSSGSFGWGAAWLAACLFGYRRRQRHAMRFDRTS